MAGDRTASSRRRRVASPFVVFERAEVSFVVGSLSSGRTDGRGESGHCDTVFGQLLSAHVLIRLRPQSPIRRIRTRSRCPAQPVR
jgi:hypothetical protein